MFNVTGQDFVSALRPLPPEPPPVPQPYIISGRINPSTVGTVVQGGSYTTDPSGLIVTLSGPVTLTTTTTDSNGNYQFSGLPDGTYTITPYRLSHTFVPVTQIVVVSGGNVANIDFTLNLSSQLTGTIRNELGTALTGVVVTINFTGPRTGQSLSSSGNATYLVYPAPAGVWVLTPQLAGYTFDPPSRTLTSVMHVSGLDFTAIPSS